MALASFLDKAALAASQVLQQFDRRHFEDILLSHRIRVTFNSTMVTRESIATLDLLVRLIARLYPTLQLIDTQKDSKMVDEWKGVARAINPIIELDTADAPTVSLVVGPIIVEHNVPTYYLGSSGWTALFSPSGPVNSGNSNNPFGAGAAACIGAANVFRTVFSRQLPNGAPDAALSLSLLDYVVDVPMCSTADLPDIDLGETHLVGLGAIGNAVVWAFSHTTSLLGELILIDGEQVEPSNLQRYVLTTQHDINKCKVSLASEFLNSSRLRVTPYPKHWGQYLHDHSKWYLTRVAVGVDTARDRIAVQAALPEKVFNAWTQSNDLGISRHPDFLDAACLACLYMPVGPRKNHSELVAEAIGLPHRERFVRQHLYQNLPVDAALLAEIAAAKRVNVEELMPFEGGSLADFYSKAVCGGTLLRLSPESGSPAQVEAPLAFQSALAGIMLAAEVVIEAGNLRQQTVPNVTRMNLLRPISRYLSEREGKNSTGACICGDLHFRGIYARKWGKPVESGISSF